ncbi:glycine zipper domain-containing protein [Rubrolithibacter danxiaensis]|uniref:glycine zipper domain-containing protein n=1 Tax=Rubrolithibacter danxiaensis TaxID=3390805 RepID=UPI003BF8E8D8
MFNVKLFLCVLAVMVLPFLFTGCASVNKTQKSTFLGSAAGGAIGAIIGKRAGNTVVGATVGAALGATTGAFIGKKLDGISGSQKNKNNQLYVIDGVPYKGKEAQARLTTITTDKIASVKFLKDAEAIEMFGSMGANGAVLINLHKI